MIVMLTEKNPLLSLLALALGVMPCAFEGLPRVDSLSYSLPWENTVLLPLTLAS